MQIDLFKNRDILKDSSRLLAQVEKRKFSLNVSRDSLCKVLESDEGFRTNILEKLEHGREYKRAYAANVDSLFPLEAMGVGTDGRRYTVILDSSNKLDYVLHRLTGCPTSAVRQIPNYERVSRDIINLNYNNLTNIKLGDFMEISDSTCSWFTDMLCEIANSGELTDNEIINNFILKLFNSVIAEVNQLKVYAIMYLRQMYLPDFIIRSKSISGIIATTNTEIDTNIILSEENYEDCHIDLLLLEKFEYFTGGFYNVFNRTD